jgi:hypothetical protein
VDAKGAFSPDATYVLQTADGANILVTGKGHVPHEAVFFETGSAAYTWLNTVVAVATAKQVDGGVSMDVFQVRIFHAVARGLGGRGSWGC